MRKADFLGFISATLVIALLALAPGFARASDNQPLSPEEQAFLARAMSDNDAQIAMATMALQKSKNPQVIALANTVIHERSALNAQLAPFSESGQSPKFVAGDDTRLASLQALDGDAFDRTFAGLLVRDHNQIISAYECIKTSASNPSLRGVVHQAVPELQGNLMAALTVLRSANWAPIAHTQALTATDSHVNKAPVFVGESLSSIVAIPW
jgi:putative membrane protein